MTTPARRDPYVALSDTAMIADAKRQRVNDADASVRAAQIVTLRDRLVFAGDCGEVVTIATKNATQVCGQLVTVAAAYVVVQETLPVPRIVLIPLSQIVTVALSAMAAKRIPEAAVGDDVTTLLTALETQYCGEAIELTLRDGATVCAPVALFGDDVVVLQLTSKTVLWVAGNQIALAAIPPPRRPGRSHTGG